MKGLTAKNTLQNRFAVTLLALLLAVAGPFIYAQVRAGNAPQRAIKISTSDPSAVATYEVSFTTASAGNLGSIRIQFCSNDPFPGTPCTPPADINLLASTLSDQTGEIGFSIDPSSTINNVLLSRVPVPTVAGTAVSYTFDGAINTSEIGTQFVRLQTFATSDGTGPASDYGGLAYAIGVEKFAISAEVPPFLLFCSGVVINDNFCNSVTGDYINFGNLSSGSASSATSELLVTTNGESGYTTQLSGNTMTSGTNTIAAMVADDVSRPGTQQFGLNLRANATPAVGVDPVGPGLGQPTADYNIPNEYRFASGEIIAGGSQPEDTRKYTVSYIVNIAAGQPIGIYVTTVTYITLANF
jgi:hypothetical protein